MLMDVDVVGFHHFLGLRVRPPDGAGEGHDAVSGWAIRPNQLFSSTTPTTLLYFTQGAFWASSIAGSTGESGDRESMLVLMASTLVLRK